MPTRLSASRSCLDQNFLRRELWTDAIALPVHSHKSSNPIYFHLTCFISPLLNQIILLCQSTFDTRYPVSIVPSHRPTRHTATFLSPIVSPYSSVQYIHNRVANFIITLCFDSRCPPRQTSKLRGWQWRCGVSKEASVDRPNCPDESRRRSIVGWSLEPEPQ